MSSLLGCVRSLGLVLMLLFAFKAQASLEKDLQDFFGDVSNTTPAGAYKGQEGGFYSGGSVFMRNPSRNIQMLHLEIPSVEAGCGGIDLHMGGFGYINSAELLKTLRTIGANAKGYLFSLALKQMSPQIMNQIEELQSWMNEANWNNINTCQAAAQLVNNTAAAFHASTVRTCIQQALKDRNENYFSARELCKSQAEVNAKNKAAANAGEPVIDNINIAWHAIEQNPTLVKLDQNLKFLLMSLTGTVVIETIGNTPPNSQYYPSKLHSSDVFDTLSSGKNIAIYRCADQKCLHMVEDTITLKPEQTFVGKIKALISSMELKVLEDSTPLTKQEKDFLESTSLPLYKMLNVYSAFAKGTALLFPTHYAEVIAMDILYRYIERGISDVMQAYNARHLPDSVSKDFLSMVDSARQRAQTLRLMQIQKTGTVEDMVAKVQVMEKQLSSLVSAQLFQSLH
ncbi:MAG: conjugal transfer protein TraH [Gammaproteobacteria bacterium]|nr:conjugal transfer protein TraH [Gammaproteobacteria bacterium]